MPKCSSQGCETPINQGVKLKLFIHGSANSAEIYVNIYACSEAHQAPEEALRTFFTQNWERICTGFEKMNQPRPVLELTEYAWVPWEEIERAVREHAEANLYNKGEVKTQ